MPLARIGDRRDFWRLRQLLAVGKLGSQEIADGPISGRASTFS